MFKKLIKFNTLNVITIIKTVISCEKQGVVLSSYTRNNKLLNNNENYDELYFDFE